MSDPNGVSSFPNVFPNQSRFPTGILNESNFKNEAGFFKPVTSSCKIERLSTYFIETIFIESSFPRLPENLSDREIRYNTTITP